MAGRTLQTKSQLESTSASRYGRNGHNGLDDGQKVEPKQRVPKFLDSDTSDIDPAGDAGDAGEDASRTWSGTTVVGLPPLSTNLSRLSDELPYGLRTRKRSPSATDSDTTYASYTKHARLTSESSELYYGSARYPPSSPSAWDNSLTDPIEGPDEMPVGDPFVEPFDHFEVPPTRADKQATVTRDSGLGQDTQGYQGSHGIQSTQSTQSTQGTQGTESPGTESGDNRIMLSSPAQIRSSQGQNAQRQAVAALSPAFARGSPGHTGDASPLARGSYSPIASQSSIRTLESPRKLRVSPKVARGPSHDRATALVRQLVDNCPLDAKLDFHNMQLGEVSPELKDFQYTVATGPDGLVRSPNVDLILSNNRIRAIPSFLFDVTCIKFLSLRNNSLAYIPPSIRKLTALSELSLGGNELKFLPAEILDLPSLKTLSATPNPFLTKSSPDTQALTTKKYSLDFVGSLNAFTYRTNPRKHPVYHRSVLSLVEQSLLSIGNVPEPELNGWQLDEHQHSLVQEGLAAIDDGVRCSQCSHDCIRGVSTGYEWWGPDVVFKRRFCTFACHDAWMAAIGAS